MDSVFDLRLLLSVRRRLRAQMDRLFNFIARSKLMLFCPAHGCSHRGSPPVPQQYPRLPSVHLPPLPRCWIRQHRGTQGRAHQPLKCAVFGCHEWEIYCCHQQGRRTSHASPHHPDPAPQATLRPLMGWIRWRLLGCSVHLSLQRSGAEWLSPSPARTRPAPRRCLTRGGRPPWWHGRPTSYRGTRGARARALPRPTPRQPSHLQ